MQNNSVNKGRIRSLTFFCAALKPGRWIYYIFLLLPFLMFCPAAPVSAETGLMLSEAISRAMDHSFSIKAARHEAQAAEKTYAGTKANRYPSLSLSARSYYTDDLPTVDFPTGKKEIGSNENYQADFNLSMPIYTGGRISNRIGLEFENSREKQAAIESERMAVAYRCRQAYLNLMISVSLKEAAMASLERLTIINRDTRNRFDNGLADSIDLLESELAFEKGNQEVDRRENNLANASTALARLMGMDESEIIIPAEVMPLPDDRPLLKAPAPDIDRPELKQLDHAIEAADKAVVLEKGSYLPVVSGFAGYSYGMPNKDWFNKTWNDYFTIGLALNWGFNLGGKSSKLAQAASLKSASARMMQKKMHDDLQTGRDLAFNNLGHAYRTYQISSKEYDIAQRQYHLADLRQREGQISINRLLEMEAALAATEQQHKAAIIQYYLAETEYLYAVGSSKIFGGL